MIGVEDFLGRLVGARARGQGRWVACCPAHDDRTPSLSIAEGPEGAILLKCFAGCATADVLAAVSLSFRDVSPDRPWPKRRRSASPAPALEPEAASETRSGADLWRNRHRVASAHREAHDRREAAWRARKTAYGVAFDRLMQDYRQASAFWQDSARELPPCEHRKRAIAGIAATLAVEQHARGRAGTRALIRKLLAWEIGELVWANEADSLLPRLGARDRRILSEARALLADGADEQTEAR